MEKQWLVVEGPVELCAICVKGDRIVFANKPLEWAQYEKLSVLKEYLNSKGWTVSKAEDFELKDMRTNHKSKSFEDNLCKGEYTTADGYYHRDVSLDLLDAEESIEYHTDKIKEINAKLASVHGKIKSGKLKKDYSTSQLLYKLYKSRDYNENQKKEVEYKIDRSLVPAQKQTDNYIPYHWMYSNEYWKFILDSLVHWGDKIKRQPLLRLWSKIHRAKEKSSISSKYYFKIGFWTAKHLNMRQELNRILAYGAACHWSEPHMDENIKELLTKDKVEKNKELEYKRREIQTDPFLFPVKYEDEFFCSYQLSENEIIDAIDRKHFYVRAN